MGEDSPLPEVNSDDSGIPSAVAPTSPSAAPGVVSEDELRRVLSDGRRRSIIAFLDSEDEPVHRRAVLAHLAPDDEERARIATRLHHVHLPKLVDSGLLVHDRDEDTLESGPNAPRALRALTAPPGDPVAHR